MRGKALTPSEEQLVRQSPRRERMEAGEEGRGHDSQRTDRNTWGGRKDTKTQRWVLPGEG